MSRYKTLPQPTERFGPRKHAAILSCAIQDAWQAYQQANIITPEDSARVATRLCVQVKELYPAADMDVLKRYGRTNLADRVSVTIHNGADYSQRVMLELPENVRVPGRAWPTLTACAPVWGPPDYGLTKNELVRLQKEEDRWLEHLTYCERHNRHRVPDDLNPFFAAIVRARQEFKAEYHEATNWPANVKGELGRYPTWQEIADRFLVLGGWLRTQWTTQP